MTEEFVTLKELAPELGLDRSNARKYVLRQGIKPKKRRTADSGGQLALTVSAEEAAFLKRTREEEGFLGSAKPAEKEVGEFYAIQLVPELAPNRIKLGFAADVTQRLAQHRTSAPTATVLKSWPCKRSWEVTIIDALSLAGGKLLLNEVFEFDNLEAMIARADSIFTLLPNPATKMELSDKSPIATENVEDAI